MAFQIKSISLRSASPGEYEQLNALKNAIRREILPDDPPWPRAEDVGRWQARPALVRDASWVALEGSPAQVLALGQADIYETGDNLHVLWFNIEVSPANRRRGIASAMLRLILDQARNNGRRLLLVDCSDRIPASAAFLTSIGASKGLEEPVNQLRLDGLDRRLLGLWLEREGELSAEFALGIWTDRYPEERLSDLVALLQVTSNDQPRDRLQVEDIHFSPELIDQFDAEQRAGGDQRWSMYLVSRQDNRLVGLSEVYWNPARPAILHQGFTGVMPEHRRRGLGRWLKAAMLERVLRERPEVEVVRAGNATSNAPMLGINRQLGFKQLVAWSTWQVDSERVERYLAGRG